MGKRISYILEIIVAVTVFWIGISGAEVLFIHGIRTAAITLGITGLVFYFTNTMGYVMNNPLHPVALLGSIFAIIGVVLLIIQIFNIQFWVLGNPVLALTYFALAMVAKAVVGIFMPLAGMY